MWKCRKFSRLFCPVSVWSQKKKKRSSRCWRHLFLWFYVDFQKKKDLRLNSASFLHALCATYQSEVPWTAAVYGFWREQKRRFLAGEKRQNLQNFSAKMPEKTLHFFVLIGNTGHNCDQQSEAPQSLCQVCAEDSHQGQETDSCGMLHWYPANDRGWFRIPE